MRDRVETVAALRSAASDVSLLAFGESFALWNLVGLDNVKYAGTSLSEKMTRRAVIARLEYIH